MEKKKAKILRAFYLDGNVCKVGDIVELPKFIFEESCNCGRAVPYVEEKEPEVSDKKVDPVKESKVRKRGGKGKDVNGA